VQPTKGKAEVVTSTYQPPLFTRIIAPKSAAQIVRQQKVESSPKKEPILQA
jgi:hypothetical protein